MMTRKEMIKWAKDTVDKIFDSREPRDNWEYIKEFCDKFGIPKDLDELDVLVSYVRDKKHREQKPLSTKETEQNSIAFLEQMRYTCIPPGEEQKPSEWSEEDELMATSIIDILKLIEHMGATDMKIDWLENRIKSLRPQPHWKPSEEQMEALECAERWYSDNMGYDPHLYQLLCDLKNFKQL